MVFVGTMGAPPSRCGRNGDLAGAVTVRVTPVIAEKPFISTDKAGRFHLHIPSVGRGRVGPDFSWGTVVAFEHVFVARPADTARAINAQLREGLHVVLTPGIYLLEAPLELNAENQVLLGLGFATLVAPEGAPAVRVGNVDGVRVAGLLLQAGPGNRDSLLEWGDGLHRGNAQNPGFLQDVFARVGGTNNPAVIEVSAKVMVRIGSGNVVGDNLWLWRADHGVTGIITGGANPCDTGLEVTGDNVTMYGLAVEHTLQDLVKWSGDGGATYFYQSEFPYDVTQDYGDAGYAGYHVDSRVETHHGYGVGVYHYFRDNHVVAKTGIVVPPWLENSFISPLAVYLNGRGEMLHIINERGPRTANGSMMAQWYCDKAPDVPYVPPATTSTITMTTTSSTDTFTATSTTRTSTTVTSTVTTSTTTTSRTATSTSTTTTSTRTSTTTSSSTSTTTTTTTQNQLWFLAFALQPDGSFRPMAWLALAVPLNVGLACLVAVCTRCRRQRPQDEPQVPVSRLLSLLGSPHSGHSSPRLSRLFGHGATNSPSLSRLFGSSPDGMGGLSPFGGASPLRSDAARTLSLPMGASARHREALAQGHTLSPRGADSPGRAHTARMLSLSSGNCFSPDSLSPWLARSPERRGLVDAAGRVV